MFDIAIMCGKIRLGKQGEHLARRVPFELGLWENQFGEGRCELLHQRNGDEAPYPVNLTVENNVAYWNVTSVDTAVAGKGECELRYIVNDVVVKSTTYVTKVSEALGEGAEVPPEGAKPWVDEVLEAAQKVEDATTHQPVIGENGNWFTWDAEISEYIDTGVSANDGMTEEEIAELLKDKAPIDHTHDLAGTVYKDVSLVGITTGGGGSEVNSITDNRITESVYGIYKIDIQGDVDIKAVVETYVDCEFYIDDILISSGSAFEVEWSGTIENGITIKLNDGTVRFDTFKLLEHVNGFMSAEQAEKLENTPTTAEVENLINKAFGIVAEAFDEVHEYAESLGGEEA